jgi:Helix-turn-helix domain
LRESKMPWKECDPMDERLKFIARLLDGEKMAGLCREFGISRKTGYKVLARYIVGAGDRYCFTRRATRRAGGEDRGEVRKRSKSGMVSIE